MSTEFYKPDKGLRFNEGRTRFDLLPIFGTQQVAKIMTAGAVKYTERNWEKGMRWTKVLASLKRHLQAIEEGEDYDKETGCLHSAHVAVNALFLTEYYKIYPQGDDRVKFTRPLLRIGLDIDGVLANFSDAFCAKFDIKTEVYHWFWTYAWREYRSELKDDAAFWLGLEPLISGEDMPFEPSCYCTDRPVDVSITERWLEQNHFPCVPVITVNGSKVERLREANIDVFIDDSYNNFVELNNAGICTYLWDAPHNRKHDVGYRRIKNLKEILYV